MRMNLEERDPMQKNQPPPAEVNALIALYNACRYAEAESRTRTLLGHYPDFGFGWKLLGGILQIQGKEALPTFHKVAELMPEDAEAHFNLGVVLKNAGQLDRAAASYRKAVALQPGYAEAHSNLGNTLKDLGQLDDAVTSYRRALTVKPDSADAHNNLGTALKDLGQLDEAVASYRKAVALQPDFALAYYNLGNTQKELGQFDAAVASYRKAIEFKPDFADAHNNLGTVLKELGQFDAALASYRRVIELRPGFAEAHNNLGVALKDLGQLDTALASYRKAIELKPNYAEALNNLASLLVTQGELITALNIIVRSLQIEDMRETKSIFVGCVRQLSFTHVDNFVRDAMARALSEPWCRPVDLAGIGADIVKLNRSVGECIARAITAWPQRLEAQELFGTEGIAAVFDDALLRCLLKSAPICRFELERFLTMVRFTLLGTASGTTALEDVEESALIFYAALAQQCFINEYVFSWTDGEAKQARNLRDSLIAALEFNAQIPVLWPVAVACYFPLNSLPFADRLLDRPWPAAMDAVLVQQVREPEQERQCRVTIPQLTAIDDAVSLLVQSQYEENPYPRWIKAPPASTPETVDAVLRKSFPYSSFRPLGKSSFPDILIAGCGTGQQPIQAAQRFRGAVVLAVDLSLSSLCYAKRKTQELGLTMIEYAQADITKLGSLGRSFDIIESTGVLHHLADPLAGWQVLLSLLRPGGAMRLGFYSEVARRGIVRARTFIAEQGYDSTAEDIRQCRQKLMDSDDSASFGVALKSGDFFSTSACRDLLFHIQEHRMTLTGIDAFLRENDLRFLGFEIGADVLRAYKLSFPDDGAATNLGQWQIFENETPDTFIGMYQFWIQKSG